MFDLWVHPYQFSVEPLVDFEQSCDGVNPEVVATVTFQDGVGDPPIHLAVQIFCQYLQKTVKKS